MTTETLRAERPSAMWFVVPALVMADLITKFWALTTLGPAAIEISFGNFVALRLTQNTGVAFGALDFGFGWGRVVPLVLTIAFTAVVGLWMVKASSEWRRSLIALIFAGAVSNIIDRLANGAVTDFIEYRWFGEAMFTGNLADIWISVGAVGSFGAALLQHFARSAEGPPSRGD